VSSIYICLLKVYINIRLGLGDADIEEKDNPEDWTFEDEIDDDVADEHFVDDTATAEDKNPDGAGSDPQSASRPHLAVDESEHFDLESRETRQHPAEILLRLFVHLDFLWPLDLKDSNAL